MTTNEKIEHVINNESFPNVSESELLTIRQMARRLSVSQSLKIVDTLLSHIDFMTENKRQFHTTHKLARKMQRDFEKTKGKMINEAIEIYRANQ